MHRHPLYDRLNLCHFFFIVSEFVCSIPNLDSLSVLNKFLLDVQCFCLLIGNWLMVMQAVKLLVPVRQKTIKKSNNLFLYPVRSPLPHSDIIYGDSLGLSRILWAPEAVCVGVCTCNTWVIFGTTPVTGVIYFFTFSSPFHMNTVFIHCVWWITIVCRILWITPSLWVVGGGTYCSKSGRGISDLGQCTAGPLGLLFPQHRVMLVQKGFGPQ